MTKRIDWYFSKEAKKGRTAHLAGHSRLGSAFSKCGKTLGRKRSSEFFDPCAACAIEQKKESDRDRRRKEMEEEAPKKAPTPELDKLSVVAKESQRIGMFIDWLLEEKKVELAFYHRHGKECDGFNSESAQIEPEYTCAEESEPKIWGQGHKHDLGIYGCSPKRVFGCDLPCQSLTPFRFTPEKLLAEFFDIDLDKVENERRAILDSIRTAR